ncbi:SRPBCC family protein [Pelagibacterium limicola]|uniref:SRPBCC family protein n=1 Tax=Pelagibacterium limicola TaxID=2791022 RepID=UPI0018AFE22D|nr:SRPBCC family protein [Pelagibacterium limicola]
MHFDFATHLGAIERSVSNLERDGAPAKGVTLSRTYATTVEDLWDAVTNAERIPRWFLPINGDLKLGGKYQLEGNASGTITDCDAPTFFAATWEFGGGVSWIEVRIEAEGNGARLTLCHIAPVNEFWDQYGPGAVGVGWDLGLVGLVYHLAGSTMEKFDETAFATSEEGRAFIGGASDDWARAAIDAGDDAAAARKAAKATTAFYTGQPAPEA